MRSTETPGKGQAIALWFVRGALALAFALAGASKLAGLPPQPEQFAHWGFPLWFMYAIGLFEVTLAIGLLVQRTSGAAALMLAGLMVGAAGTLATHGDYSSLPPSIIFFILLLGIAYAQRDTLSGLLGRAARRA